MDGIGGVRVNEHSLRDNVRLFLGGESFHRGRRRKHVGKDEKADRHAEGRSHNPANEEMQ